MPILLGIIMACFFIPTHAGADVAFPTQYRKAVPIIINPYDNKKNIDIKFSKVGGGNYEDFNVYLSVPGPCTYAYSLYKKEKNNTLKLIKTCKNETESWGENDCYLYDIDISNFDIDSISSYKLYGKVVYWIFNKKEEKSSINGTPIGITKYEFSSKNGDEMLFEYDIDIIPQKYNENQYFDILYIKINCNNIVHYIHGLKRNKFGYKDKLLVE